MHIQSLNWNHQLIHQYYPTEPKTLEISEMIGATQVDTFPNLFPHLYCKKLLKIF